uniref:Arrestin_C domain-containing protein n=1 Tax=Strongyloides papillosus TaxID=174720 RepID=A0A0N5B4G9_STREA
MEENVTGILKVPPLDSLKNGAIFGTVTVKCNKEMIIKADFDYNIAKPYEIIVNYTYSITKENIVKNIPKDCKEPNNIIRSKIDICEFPYNSINPNPEKDKWRDVTLPTESELDHIDSHLGGLRNR